METFSAQLSLCAGKSPATGEFPSQRPVVRSVDIFFDLRMNKRLSKQSWGWWYQTPSRSLWRHCNAWRSAPRSRWALDTTKPDIHHPALSKYFIFFISHNLQYFLQNLRCASPRNRSWAAPRQHCQLPGSSCRLWRHNNQWEAPGGGPGIIWHFIVWIGLRS